MAFVCKELETATNIYGGHDCKLWVQQPPSLTDELAITPAQAGGLSVAICSLLILGYTIGLIGNMMFKLR